MSQKSKPSSLLSWLESSPLYPQVYWFNPLGNEEIASIGTNRLFDRLPDAPEKRVWHFRDFMLDTRKTDVWNTFPESLIIEPLEERSQFDPDFSRFSRGFPHTLSQSHLPSQERWNELIDTFYQTTLDKAVLSRMTTLDLSAPPSIYSLLASLSQSGTVYALLLDEETAFLGATPEMLFRRHHSTLVTEALAGTRKRGATCQDDLDLENALRHNPKERQECLYVKDAILNELSQISSQVHCSDRFTVKKTPTVQHLHQSFSAQLTPISHQEIINRLHPTPAIGGVPKERSLEWILAHEPFDRGYFSAPIGWVHQHSAHFCVALRCALIKTSTLHLFAGAGIVTGSVAENEWDEMTHKMSHYLNLFSSIASCGKLSPILSHVE
ncbi:MAG: Isochorismate synthase MenF [Chlamydiia bacterium]|nr:Isochorismate synthase MenF [Chlamydiia bacterium]